MLKPPKSIKYKEMEKDPFLDSVNKLQNHYKNKRSLYIQIALSILAIVGIINFLIGKSEISNSKSSALLGISLIALEKNDLENAKIQFESLIDEFPETENAQIAKFYLGKIKYNEKLYSESEKLLIDHYKSAKNNLLKISTIVMLSDIYSMNKDYSIALDWLKKGEKIQSNPYFKNLLQIEKAKVLLKLGKKDESKDILSSLLEKENINQRHKQLAEELISSNIG